MPERVLPNPLSGQEVRTAILDQIGERLRKDCYLAPDHAYDSFRCKVKIELVCNDVGRSAEVNIEETVQQGDPDDALLEKAESEFEMDPLAPNEVRVNSGQEVPVLTKDAGGRPVQKGIKYSKKQLAAK